MKVDSILGIYRERIFSPGKVQEDAAILDATLEELSAVGCQVDTVHAEAIDWSMPRSGWVLTMAQSPMVLAMLEHWARLGTRIVNSVASIQKCYRKPLTNALQEAGVPIPPGRIVPLSVAEEEITLRASAPVWLKRGDVHAIQAGDVAPVSSKNELLDALRHFSRQNVTEILVQNHVAGPVVKFYGVAGGDYFRAFLASTGEDITTVTGSALREVAQSAAVAVGLEVYGGDAVMTDNGSVTLIDLNDWPSFSRCCRDAAKNIAFYLRSKDR
jgi:glutathione synthase/RimK-type ligase-like ATP-grasp enzyme